MIKETVPLEGPVVSVVIPTTLRKELPRAISSILCQTLGREAIEIIVVVDRSPESVSDQEEELLEGADDILYSGGKRDGGHCRKLGTEAATGNWIAYLDDDDEWVPDKLALQLAAAETAGPQAVVSSRVVEVSQAGEGTAPLPTRLYAGGPIEQYLFMSRGPFVGRASIFTSTLLVPAEFAKKVSWRTGLARHQDWDWLCRAQAMGAAFVHLPDPLVKIAVASSNSISRSSRWRESLQWASEYFSHWGKKTSADFVAGQPLRYALQARSGSGVLACGRTLAQLRTLPSLQSLALGLAGAAPRAMQEVIFFMLARLRNPRLLKRQKTEDDVLTR